MQWWLTKNGSTAFFEQDFYNWGTTTPADYVTYTHHRILQMATNDTVQLAGVCSVTSTVTYSAMKYCISALN